MSQLRWQIPVVADRLSSSILQPAEPPPWRIRRGLPTCKRVSLIVRPRPCRRPALSSRPKTERRAGRGSPDQPLAGWPTGAGATGEASERARSRRCRSGRPAGRPRCCCPARALATERVGGRQCRCCSYATDTVLRRRRRGRCRRCLRRRGRRSGVDVERSGSALGSAVGVGVGVGVGVVLRRRRGCPALSAAGSRPTDGLRVLTDVLGEDVAAAMTVVEERTDHDRIGQRAAPPMLIGLSPVCRRSSTPGVPTYLQTKYFALSVAATGAANAYARAIVTAPIATSRVSFIDLVCSNL